MLFFKISDSAIKYAEKAWNSDKFWRTVVLGTIASGISIKIFKKTFEAIVGKMLDIPPRKISNEKDVVYMYTFPRSISKGVPNMSPYALKLETWLRVHGIKYEVCSHNSSVSDFFSTCVFNF